MRSSLWCVRERAGVSSARSVASSSRAISSTSAIRRGIGCEPATRWCTAPRSTRSGSPPLAAARDARVRRVVYVSTIAAFGNTHGAVAAEGYAATAPPTSAYEDTKRRTHEIALEFARAGLPLVIVQPGQVYGPNDHSEVG